ELKKESFIVIKDIAGIFVPLYQITVIIIHYFDKDFIALVLEEGAFGRRFPRSPSLRTSQAAQGSSTMVCVAKSLKFCLFV
ncbi:hypothetical protein MUO74_02420, partial [Candidatus Bathyarchaeota archaeon]|nr:hypothetical protein [Candidatus Bathyarchaeota archaeon]